MKTILENWQRFTQSHTKEHEEELKTIVGELEKASEMHASQAKRGQQILDETDDDKLEEHNLSSTTYPTRFIGLPKVKTSQEMAMTYSGGQTELICGKGKWSSKE